MVSSLKDSLILENIHHLWSSANELEKKKKRCYSKNKDDIIINAIPTR